ncbi:MAG: class I SAM-dependent methyltransferase [Nanoarchaeota archaeon]|nr:class I SAM-dependent methyltransferase [Nanoarchaeota archaeon]MBU1444926.1 class I SAM-dependent methyltransferase [Nanoarchaeota archaeon]MBU2406708.1 class I SAM-dependent methyltransferase [Nanoarchaeota archaeon]MBU2420590.1 class I SAM-dependent methyltransferase [Nanoarchaeota archaeon]MBU2475595.1 class I SAM-dependent methyltransferase [Nanoarchaeota archaeon]
MPTDKGSIKEYNKNFKEWLNKKGLAHSHLEKPAMYSLLGNVRGKTILCLGCGAGEECAYIKSLGAKKVIGVDISKGLIKLAKRNFPDIEFKVMDMEKLKFAKSSFDLIYSSLVLHYVKNWVRVFNEVKKVLKKNGVFLFSTHHPAYSSALKKIKGNEKLQILGYKRNNKTKKIEVYGDYLRDRKISEIWFKNFKVTYYYKSFSSIMKDILKSNFKITDCIEPRPLNSAKRIDLVFWEKFSKLPSFLIFKLQK